MSGPITVLVTGADQHQGLAVIRGLGLAGFRVVACGAHRHSLGFYSRFASVRARYTSPFDSQRGFVTDIVRTVQQTGATLIVPAVESTLVVLNEWRDLVERYATLAAPSPATLEYAIDKGNTLALARRLGVPTPRTVQGESTTEILTRAAALRFPVAIKPRGHGLHPTTANTLGFKVQYARTQEELRERLQPFALDARALLVQEYVPGTGRCVAAVCRSGEPLALFAYSRDREVPLSGGVSVLRRSIPLDETLERHATALLREIGWHGVAMVEFKYDAPTQSYTLMEINGRFQASTALSLDAGLNLPQLVASLYSAGDAPAVAPYRVGVEERWLRGDLMALYDALTPRSARASTLAPSGRPPSRAAVAWRFVRDFRPGMRYDEFKRYDWKPGVAEVAALLGMLGSQVVAGLRGAAAYVRRAAGRRGRRLTGSPTQRSIRA